MNRHSSPVTRHSDVSLPDDVVLSVRHVSKKFCRNLKRSMLYGMQDLARNMLGIRPKAGGGVKGEGLSVKGETLNVSEMLPESGTPFTNNDFSLTDTNAHSAHNDSRLTNNFSSSPPPSLPPLREDEFWALRDLNFELRRGECLGVIGANGSGKSTLLRLVTGIFPPDAGEIKVRGRTGALIALGAGFHPHMTGRENIYLNGAILGMRREDIDANMDNIISMAGIGDFIDAPVSTYSSGMYVRLGFSVATAIRPDLLLIDEVLAVGDVNFRIRSMRQITGMLKHAAVVLVTHQLEWIGRIADRVMMLDAGRVVFDGEARQGVIFAREFMRSQAERNTREQSEIHIMIASLRIHSLRLQPTTIACGESAFFIIDYESTNTIDIGYIAINISHEDGAFIGQYHSLNLGHNYFFSKGLGTLTIPLGRITLSVGRFDISLAIIGNDMKNAWVAAPDCANLWVTGGAHSSGFVEFGRV